MRTAIVTMGLFGCAASLFAPREAHAQGVPPIENIPPTAERNDDWEIVSHVSMVLGASAVFLMPRVYYSDPEATVGWKGRWHVSMLAPAMSLIAATWMIDSPIKSGIESTRPGCTVEGTRVSFPDSGCETFGGPSSHAFASWGTTGAGLTIFLVDTLKWSDGRFHPAGFVGNILFPLTASVFTTVGRAVGPDPAEPFEDGGQIVAGALPGFFTGALLGLGYSLLQEPNCGYGNNIICW